MESPPNSDLPITTTAASATSSIFNHVPLATEIPIYALMVACSQDPSPLKLNLGIGVYRTEEGKPLLLNVVKKAEEMMIKDIRANKEYLPITGLSEFTELSAKLMFGADSAAIKEKRVTTVQCLSGSGSLRIGAELLARHYHQHIVYIPQPTYSNHPNFFITTGFSLRTYRYYDPLTQGLDFQGLIEDLSSAPSGSIVLLHACAHNPTGVDPTVEQWEEMRQLIRSKGLFPFFDSAYQGFVTGNLEEDARAVRMFVEDGGESIVVQSFSKNMGLYGERVGALNIVCKRGDVARLVESQLKLIIRPMYSSPPIHGATIAATILKNSDMYEEWTTELRTMKNRILLVRQQLYNALLQRGTPGDWSHVIKHVGLFTYSGLTEDQVDFLTRKYHIYMPSDGRINMSGLSSKAVPYLADAIHDAITTLTN